MVLYAKEKRARSKQNCKLEPATYIIYQDKDVKMISALAQETWLFFSKQKSTAQELLCFKNSCTCRSLLCCIAHFKFAENKNADCKINPAQEPSLFWKLLHRSLLCFVTHFQFAQKKTCFLQKKNNFATRLITTFIAKFKECKWLLFGTLFMQCKFLSNIV